MWTQTWNNILDISTPYPGKEALDVTPQMKKQVITQVYYIHSDQLCWFNRICGEKDTGPCQNNKTSKLYKGQLCMARQDYTSFKNTYYVGRTFTASISMGVSQAIRKHTAVHAH